MKEIRIHQLGLANTNMLVTFYSDGEMIDYEIYKDTKDTQRDISAFFFGEYEHKNSN